MTAIVIIMMIGTMYFIGHGFASVIIDVMEYRRKKQATEELHKMWESKTGVYSYLNKTDRTRA